MQNREAIEYCRRIHQHHGKSYYFATAFFPKKLREATWVLYAFFRAPDEIVDNAPAGQSIDLTKQQLQSFIAQWRTAMDGTTTKNPILDATAQIFKAYRIPASLGEDFLSAMMQDTTVHRYATYTDLKRYMWGSAAVVGHMMSYVIGFKDQSALPHATALGEAMQLTNVLRDIQEDAERGRIYLPQEDLDRFQVPETEIRHSVFSDRFKTLMQFQIKRADDLYDFANKGIPLLNPQGRYAVRCASHLYRAILRKIEQLDYNIFNARAHTSKFEKFGIAAKCLFH
ncbi:phytoene/squalene synthase family protein [Candidatus Uhrbacteria bacterium]|nr:phytoene/squalene synthase family protein [Candidatus Uhrbacteria bacterium]MBD3283844.1 phytoene/squalene synthase family protein [Candidatus Uhrbacteria bacterium]